METAEEFLKRDNGFDDKDIELLVKSLKTENRMDISDIHVTMIEFAKMHVEAALQSANENVRYDYSDIEAIQELILNAYPLTNIK